MAGEETTDQSSSQGNIKTEYNAATVGMNMDNTVNQVPKGAVTYALNAAVENFDANSVNYQNEPGNEFCLQFPEGYVLIGEHAILEQNKHVFFLVNPTTEDSEIGYMENNDCVYHTYINAKCLNFNIKHPIHKAVHKITNCTTEIYWTDGLNSRRFLDLVNPPYKVKPGTDVCANETIPEIDCNKMRIQPDFDIPQLEVTEIRSGGDLTAGTYQFAIQYCDSAGYGFTSYYSVTNPTPIANPSITTPNFNYQVGKSILLNITNIDTTGYFKYFNLAVIKTVNNIPSVELVGTYFIDKREKEVIYTGQNVTQIRLTVDEIFEKFPYYDIAQDLTAVQDILVWDNLVSIEKINYQKIANQITLNWETWRIPETENYADELNATKLRGYLRDEVYAFEIVFLLKNGKQTDGFHIPGRIKGPREAVPDVPSTNDDFIGVPYRIDPSGVGYSPYWKIYNTGSVTGFSPDYSNATDYKGPYQYGEFAYWESTELYPCNTDVWGDLANTPIRHHKFPDVLISPIFESKLFTGASSMVMGNNAVFPMGVKIDIQQVHALIQSSQDLTQEQKDDIVGFKIVRGDRGTNKSIIAKGMLRNVASYERDETSYYFANYPYNDVRQDPFLMSKSNAFTANSMLSGNITPRSFTIHIAPGTAAVVEFTDVYTGVLSTRQVDNTSGTDILDFDVCGLDFPRPNVYQLGNKPIRYYISCNTYKRYKITTSNARVFFTAAYYTDVVTKHYDPANLPITTAWNTNNTQTIPQYCLSGSINCNQQNALVANSAFIFSPFNVNGQQVSPTEFYYDAITIPYCDNSYTNCNGFNVEEIGSFGYDICAPVPLNTYKDHPYRLIFNSPETSFGQPFLGKILRLEDVIYGAGMAHFTQVKDNAYYKLLTAEAQSDAYDSSAAIAQGNITALFTAYQTYLEIYINGITRRNYAWSFNSIAKYNYNNIIDNNLGKKQRELDIAQYLIPGVQSVGDNLNVNNWNRESSVFLKTIDTKLNRPISSLPLPKDTPSLQSPTGPVVEDNTRFVLSDGRADCNAPGKNIKIDTVVYYASLKNEFVNQWGQMYSYDTIDTGFQRDITPLTAPLYATIFGGDTFITKFSYKIKLPFFIDNRVNAPDDSDIFYDEIGNVAYPQYWHSSRSILSNKDNLTNFISFKAHNFDCPNKQTSTLGAGINNPGRTFYDGKFYLFAYGVPSFYCESSYNVDLRQAFNNKEGDFWPHVSTNIPDDWFQESFVSIANDNTYYYNVTYSKQNKENYFTHLPVDWTQNLCRTYFPFRAIYSDVQTDYSDEATNNWLLYRPLSRFDFPQNYGGLTSLDGIQNKGVLARFENKSLLYNQLLTIDTSNPKAAYVGNPKLFENSPPIDFAETDLGYVGSQNKMLLKIPQGQISIDAKRGQVFLISGDQAVDLSAYGSGMNRWFTDHLAFEIIKYFPDIEQVVNGERIVIKGVDTDNHFNGCGLHGVYDSKYDRVIITKLDYIPTSKNVKYDRATKDFYVEHVMGSNTLKTIVNLTDPEYFCNRSWTLSFNMNTKSWISFHSYIPNFYIAENNFFYSGQNGCCDDLQALAINEIPIIKGRPAPQQSSKPIYTTTTSTTLYIGCDIEGTIIETSCDLAGDAYDISPITTTTTTTTCRPMGLPIFYMIAGYRIGGSFIQTSDSFDEACYGFTFLSSITNLPTFLPTFIQMAAESLTVGVDAYDGSSDTTCIPFRDGWYPSGELDINTMTFTNSNIYHVESGVITEIVPCICDENTTTTTTTTLYIEMPPCCSILFQTGNDVQYLHYFGTFDTATLPIPTFTPGYGIAMTSNKLWSVDTKFVEWNITTSPFTAVYNRDITFGGGFTTNSGIVAINDTTLIGADTSVSPNEIVELDVSGATSSSTTKVILPANREVVGNPLYNTDGKLLLLTKDTITSYVYISQYDYGTGSLDIEIDITNSVENPPTGIFECNCEIYVVEPNGYISIVDLQYSNTLINSSVLPYPVQAVTQLGSCVNTSFTTTTTSTTIP